MPLVSWIIPVLNGMPYLPAMLESLHAQTSRDFEVLVWDNGSSDGSLDVLRAWIPSKLPGRLFTGRPLSLGNSLRRLVEESSSPFCARIDADDISEPHRLEVQLKFLQEHRELSLVGSERTSIDTCGLHIPRRSKFPSEPHDILHATLRAPRLLHPGVLFRKSAVVEVGNYQDHSTPEIPYWSEDYDLWLRLLTKHSVAALPDALLRYRFNPQGVSESAMRLNQTTIAKRQAWISRAPAFAGIASEDLAARLWDRKLLLAWPTLIRIAQHFETRDGIPTTTRLRIPSFRNTVSTFVRREDLITRAMLRFYAARPTVKWRSPYFSHLTGR